MQKPKRTVDDYMDIHATMIPAEMSADQLRQACIVLHETNHRIMEGLQHFLTAAVAAGGDPVRPVAEEWAGKLNAVALACGHELAAIIAGVSATDQAKPN